jgi:hypothetical protein
LKSLPGFQCLYASRYLDSSMVGAEQETQTSRGFGRLAVQHRFDSLPYQEAMRLFGVLQHHGLVWKEAPGQGDASLAKRASKLCDASG